MKGRDRGRAHALRRDEAARHVAGHAARGAVATVSGQIGRFALQLVSMMVLARLLAPESFGLIAMTTAVIGFADLLRDLGLSTATVQAERVTHEQVNALFWLQAAIGVVLAIAVALASPLFSRLFAAPELTPVLAVLALSFVLSGLTAQHQAVVERRLQFRSLAVVTIASTLGAVAAAIVVAVTGGGVWALVVLQLVQLAITMVLVWRLSGWRPSRPARAPGVGVMIRVGTDVAVFNLLNFLSRNIDTVVIGRFLGAAQLGIYDRAFRLIMLPLQQVNAPISRVAVPTLSMVANDAQRLRTYYVTALGGMSMISTPLLAVLIALAEPVILVVLGPPWLPAVEVFRILAIIGIANTIAQSNGWLYVAAGRTRAQMKWAFVSRPLVVASICAGVPFGITGVAMGMVAMGVVLLIPSFWWATRDTPVSLPDVARAVLPSLVTSVACAAAAWSALVGIRAGAPEVPAVLHAAAGATAAALVYLALVRWWRPARARVFPVVASLRSRSLLAQEVEASTGPTEKHA